MLNHKELSILNSLYLKNRPCNIEELATEHKLSPRSIRTYVDRINKDLKKEFQYDCISLNKGFYKIQSPEFLHDFFQDYQVSNYSGQILSAFMLHKLLLENKINLSHFVIEFEVSRSTAKNYLNTVKEQIDAYHLKLDHSSAITLLGKESDKRQMILNLFLQLEKRELVEQELIAPLFVPYEQEVSEDMLKAFLHSMLDTLDYTLSEHSHKILLFYLKIMCYRIQQGFLLEDIFNQSFLKNSTEFQRTQKQFADFSNQLGFPLPLEESLEIINKIMGLHYSNHKEEEHHNWFEYDLFISKMIRRFSKACGYNLVGDFQLYENLLNHIKPSMYRIAHQIQLHEFDTEYIVLQSQEEFAITEEILRKLHFFPNDSKEYRDEIALICIYFKQALEKQKREVRKNVLLISNYGYGSSRLMMEKIQEHYHVGDMTWIPSQEWKQMDKEQYHLLISTDGKMKEKIEKDALLPVVHISPFFQTEDRQKLSQYLYPKEIEKINLSSLLQLIETHCSIDNLESLQEDLLTNFPIYDDTKNKQGILDFMKEESILLDVQADTVQQVMELAGGLLEKQGCITPSYTENLIESFENYGVYMMIDEDVAIPHTKNTGNVHETGFTFIRLQSPIHFENHSLSMFFTFCTRNNKEHLEALILIADIIKDEETKKSMETMSSPEEILAFLEKNEQKK